MIKLIVPAFFLFFVTSCNQYRLDETLSNSSDLSSFSLKNCQYVRNSSGQVVSWKSASPITFYLSKKIPEQWREPIKEAAQVWVTAEGQRLINIKSDLSSSENPANDKKNIVYWMDDGSLFSYQQAQTVTRWNVTQIQDADVLINSKDFKFFDHEATDKYRVHMKSLLVHEFGHALGLKHTNEILSVMYPELAFLQIRVDLADMDVTSRNCEYP